MTRLLVAAALTGGFWISAAARPPIPAPESVLGFVPCADYKLATYEQIAAYFHRLAAASPRVEVVDVGATAEGRRQILALVSSERNLARLDGYRTIARRLALARGLTDEAAGRLATDGRTVVWIDFGLHSSEVAPGQAAPLLGYRLAVDESAEAAFIRDNVILLLMPNLNPDGTTKMAEWYMSHLGTPYERARLPELYHKYAGHDNNRDWFMFNLPESRNVARLLYSEWFPQIVYNHHQPATFPARIFVPPFADPMNPHIPPLVMRGVGLVGGAITRRLEQEGRPGAVSQVLFDTWWNGGMRTAPYFHNMVGILTETAHDSATPSTHDPATFPRTFANGVPTLEPSSSYPNPYRGGTWRLRDSCDLILSASMAVLDVGARRRQEWLYDIYRMGRDAIRAGAAETYVIPADQWDAGTAARLIDALRLAGVDVGRAATPFEAAGRRYPAGSYVVSGAQPFLPYVRDLLNPQVYPERRANPGGSPERPYDITGWTLPLQMGVAVDRIPEAVAADLRPVDRASVPPGGVSAGAGAWLAVDPRANDAFVAVNRSFLSGDVVHRAMGPISTGDGKWPPGAFLVAAGARTRERLDSTARELGLRVQAVDAAQVGATRRLSPPRIAVYQAWGGNPDEGWTRWVLERFEFPFANLRDADVRAGSLRTRFDVIVLPDATYDDMIAGLQAGSVPPEYAGGMTAAGVANLEEFVRSGGTVVALDSAAGLPLAGFGLSVTDAAPRLRDSSFFVPGSLVRLIVDPSHPLGFGMPTDATAFFADGPLFEVPGMSTPSGPGDSGDWPAGDGSGRTTVAARYATRDLLRSGWMLGDAHMAGKPAVLEVGHGAGRVVLVGFRAQHRGQSHGTFKLLFNALYLGAGDPDRPGRRPTSGAGGP